ncbi:Polysaccharide biosynthesis/export protein [Maioricimonas rarisocia]|uniref:Polysaccharide biosynthesis/export protein n=1 Tax=Maioricimonas rarisocia TaxID=2528026 RepID=A0A517ZCF2_9PLAN|nr:polysaccharide biosynthesis/export family protein [Maioricimonas rarisocia]QDU40131.1 Polysaccharide biosynthesis/export protein [Maioricimonas rarisocia]
MDAIGPTRSHVVWILLVLLPGCYAPLHSPGIPATHLPDQYRMPMRTAGAPLNYSSLVAPTPPAYLLGTGDVLEITAPDLMQRGDTRPFQVQVLETGEIHLPRVGPVVVGGHSLAEAQVRINRAIGAGYLEDPAVTVTLVQKGVVNVLVLGAVNQPGVHALPRFENDIAHALAAAGGFSERAGDVIEVHRRGAETCPLPAASPEFTGNTAPPETIQTVSFETAGAEPVWTPEMARAAPAAVGPYQSYRGRSGPVEPPTSAPQPTHRPAPIAQASHTQTAAAQPFVADEIVSADELFTEETSLPGMALGPVERISLRGMTPLLAPEQAILHAGDVIVVPERKDSVFYVVGPLSETNRVRFTVGDRDREIGNGFLLPDDREIDVVTAVAMAGYIDPIYSPTTVTVHRIQPNGMPLLVHVDLIRARTDPRETVLVQPGDIIYLNPDNWWYGRRLFDRTVDRALGTAVGRWLTN